MVLPDNVLFEGKVGAQIRADLMDKCRLHTILRLPTGIFYAQGVKTNVLSFTRGDRGEEKGNTKELRIFDMRTNAPCFGKRTPLTREHFKEFEDPIRAFTGALHGNNDQALHENSVQEVPVAGPSPRPAAPPRRQDRGTHTTQPPGPGFPPGHPPTHREVSSVLPGRRLPG